MKSLFRDERGLSLSKKSSESWAFSDTDDKIEEKRRRREKQMLNQQQELRCRVVEILSMEDLVPRDHLLRQMNRAADFIHIYDFVEELYCKDNGRPSLDPVVLFKIVMIQHLFGIPSLRRTIEEIKVAYRWFLGYALSDELLHFPTVS